jgi:hypothetical protein
MSPTKVDCWEKGLRAGPGLFRTESLPTISILASAPILCRHAPKQTDKSCAKLFETDPESFSPAIYFS